MLDLLGKKVVYLNFSSAVDPSNAPRLMNALSVATQQKNDAIYLCLNSLGGGINDGIALYNLIRSLPIPVIIHNIGAVCSIAVTVYMASDYRHCTSNSIFMIHKTGANLPNTRLTADVLQTAVSSTIADDQRVDSILQDRIAETNDLFSERQMGDVWILPKRAVHVGIASEIKQFFLPVGSELYHI